VLVAPRRGSSAITWRNWEAPETAGADSGGRGLKFPFLDSRFYGILNQLVVPFIIKRLFGPDGGLDMKFELVMAGLAKIPVGHVKVVPVTNRLLNDGSAYITSKGFHIILLIKNFMSKVTVPFKNSHYYLV
jgi:hypothetical protein